MKIKGYISKRDLNEYIKLDINKDNGGTPIMFEVWKDGEDMRWCAKGSHIKKVEITIKEIK